MDYRTCKTLTGEEVYEFHKYCRCNECMQRKRQPREIENKLTLTINDLIDKDMALDYLKRWHCPDGTCSMLTLYINVRRNGNKLTVTRNQGGIELAVTDHL